MLVSGSSGTGKTSIAAAMVDAACARGERALYVSFEESPSQLIRNMRSIGLRLDRWDKKGLLRLSCHRPSGFGLEHQFGELQRLVAEGAPGVVVIDPVSAFDSQGDSVDTHAILLRQIDFLKAQGITAVLTSLTHPDELGTSNAAISSLVDTWIYVHVVHGDAERNRGLFVLKSRGMAHSNQVREFLMSNRGIELRDVYVGARGVLTGSARAAREAEDRAEALRRRQELERLRAEIEEREHVFAAERRAAEVRLAALQAEVEAFDQVRDEQQRRRSGTGKG
jgi:circadian clock protein KaiC